MKTIPNNYHWDERIESLFSIFQKNGYQLYLVGGCVRDFLMEKEHNDYDMSSDATPKQMQQIAQVNDIKLVLTGLQHGTVTFIYKHLTIETTTFRQESEYEKNRFPKSVRFTKSLKEDCQRRDFTMNAIAMDKTTIYDYFNGYDDIKNHCIRCVGDPLLRFQEDALRMLRALRFHFQLQFTIEQKTFYAIQQNAHLLKNISHERIRDELNKMLLSDSKDILFTLKNSNVLQVIIPEFIICFDVAQETPWHRYDVFTHMNAVLNATKGFSLEMKLALLFHDIAKPLHKTIDAKGLAHFLGHAKASADIAKAIMQRLKYDKKTIRNVHTMIVYHDYYLYDNRKSVHKFMTHLNGDYNMAYQILKIQVADNLGKNQTMCIQKNKMIYGVMVMLKQMQADKECFTIKELAIDGNDIKALGYQDKQIGSVLKYVLKQMINQQDKNNKNDLLKIAGGYRNENNDC